MTGRGVCGAASDGVKGEGRVKERAVIKLRLARLE